MTDERFHALQETAAALSRQLALGHGDHADRAALARAHELLAEIAAIG